MLLGGVIGAFITFTVIQSMDSPGACEGRDADRYLPSFWWPISSSWQAFFGVEKADFSWRKVIGMAVAIVGVIGVSVGNKRRKKELVFLTNLR